MLQVVGARWGVVLSPTAVFMVTIKHTEMFLYYTMNFNVSILIGF